MELSIKSILLSNSFVLLCSITIGYSLWLMLSQNQIIEQVVALPVIVYEQQQVIHESAVNTRIEGSRTQLRLLGHRPPQITFYREEHPETQINIAQNDILLPETVSLIDYWPKHVMLN